MGQTATLTEYQERILHRILTSAKLSKGKGNYWMYESYKNELHSNGIYGHEKELADLLKV